MYPERARDVVVEGPAWGTPKKLAFGSWLTCSS